MEYYVDIKNEEALYIHIGKNFQNIYLKSQVLKIIFNIPPYVLKGGVK